MIFEKSKVFTIIMAVFLMTLVADSGYAQTDGENRVLAVEHNTIVMHGQKDFATGSFQKTALDNSGCIVLENMKDQRVPAGRYISPIITSSPFSELIMSWNADTPIGTSVAIEAQVQVDDNWSPWFSWGLWNTWGRAGSSKIETKNAIAKMDIDTLIINKGSVATALRYRVSLYSNQANVTPTVKLLAASVNGRSIIPSASREKTDIVLDVPQYAQRGRDPSIAGKICSPISITMLLNYYGISVMPEEMAWNVVDNSQDRVAFGNWPFNCAYAATFGLKAYVAYYSSLDDIRRDLMEGRPIAASVMYKNSEKVPEDLPILHNAPVEATDGHLVVVRGLVQKDGKEYVVVNDPAAENIAAVKRLYLAEEFEKAWTKVVYVIEKDDNAVITQLRRIPARLVAGKDMSKITLEYVGGSINLDASDIGSIVKLKSNQTVDFLSPETTGGILAKQGKGSSIIIITKNHKVFLINMKGT